MRNLEVARLDMLFSDKTKGVENPCCRSPCPIDTGDADLNELYSNGDNSDIDLEEKHIHK